MDFGIRARDSRLYRRIRAYDGTQLSSYCDPEHVNVDHGYHVHFHANEKNNRTRSRYVFKPVKRIAAFTSSQTHA